MPQQKKLVDNMARKVYFSFHYDDVASFRANIVRNSNRLKNKRNSFTDASIWEEVEEKSVRTIKELINSELRQTSVTCVLIGSETYTRRFVRYEIAKSFEMRKGLLGVGINWIRDKDRNIKLLPGRNPFEYLGFKISDDRRSLLLQEFKDDKWIPYKDLLSFSYSHKHLDSLQSNKLYKISSLTERYSYDWDNGNKHMANWIEKAAQNVNR